MTLVSIRTAKAVPWKLQADKTTTLFRENPELRAACEQHFSTDVKFRAEDSSAVAAQAEIVIEHIRATSHTSIAAYIAFAFMVAVSGILVVFAPAGRETAATVAAAAIFAVAVVMGGIKVFSIGLPGMRFSAGAPTPSQRKSGSRDSKNLQAAQTPSTTKSGTNRRNGAVSLAAQKS
jgi:hypothetical protein